MHAKCYRYVIFQVCLLNLYIGNGGEGIIQFLFLCFYLCFKDIFYNLEHHLILNCELNELKVNISVHSLILVTISIFLCL